MSSADIRLYTEFETANLTDGVVVKEWGGERALVPIVHREYIN